MNPIRKMLKCISDGWKMWWWGTGVYSHRDNVLDDIYLRFYTGKLTKEYVDVRLQRAGELLRQSQFRAQHPTVIYVHGFKETAEQESVQVVVAAYLQHQPDTNVILLDWSNMAFGSYFVNAAPNTKKVAAAVAEEIKKLSEQGLSIPKLHIVGHSLGGQIAGFIGKELQKLDIKVPRISALDPAFPQFYPGFMLSHIEATDAEFVDIIHTDAGGYGAPVATGTVDFWPNGGSSKQPGCPRFTPIPMSDEDLCSHWRSWRFWAESVERPDAFPAVRAKNYSQFKSENPGPGQNPQVIHMGINADPSSFGNYYLTTNAASPFGKGTAGTYYQRK